MIYRQFSDSPLPSERLFDVECLFDVKEFIDEREMGR